MSNQYPIPEEGVLTVIPNKYSVKVETGKYFIFRFPYLLGNSASRLKSPKLLASAMDAFEYKHYHDNGRKQWTKRAGVEFYFGIERKHVRVVEKEGFSYPDLAVGNTVLACSVSGGSSSAGWVDYLGEQISVKTNTALSILREFLRLAVTREEAKALGIQIKLETQPESHLSYLKNTLAREKCLPAVKPGFQVELADGFKSAGLQRLSVVERVNAQRMSCDCNGGRYKVSNHQVNWVQTAVLNNIAIQKPEDFTYNYL